jgi:hypothetical protein
MEFTSIHVVDRENQTGGAKTPLSSSRGFSLLPDVGGPHEGPELINCPQSQASHYRTLELVWHPVGAADRAAA